MYQTAPAVPYIECIVIMAGEKLTVALKFTYLGSTLSRKGNINEEVQLELHVLVQLLADYQPVCGKEEY